MTMKHGGGGLMVWGCFTWWNIGPLVKIDGIMKKEDYLSIQKTILLEFVDDSAYPEEEVIFQQDNDRKHEAKIVKTWLGSPKFYIMEWPVQSPDLNPIENVWVLLKKRLPKYDTTPTGMGDPWCRVQADWSKIPHSHIEKLVESRE